MIKKYIRSILVGASLFVAFSSQAQTTVASFDSLVLDSTGYWIPTGLGQNFTDNGIIFSSSYDTNWGGYWSGGFGYANHTDTVTAGYLNNYSTATGMAYSGDQFAIVDGSSGAKVSFDTATKVQGFYISNSTYSALSMKNGDGFAKVFGADTLANGSDTLFDGTTVTGSDWFKLTVTPYHGDSLYASEEVEYYLADYRFADDNLDYIVNDWRWFDLTSIPESDSLEFVLSSSDVSAYGMNTPSYFVMDDFTIGQLEEVDGIRDLNSLISVYPNPTNNFIHFKIPSNDFEITLFDNTGRIILTSKQSTIDLSNLENGMYFASIVIDEQKINKRIIKN